MSLGLSVQRGVHGVYATVYDVQGRSLASHDSLRSYGNDWRSIIHAIFFKGAFSVKYWAYAAASSLEEAATASCLGPLFRLPRVDL